MKINPSQRMEQGRQGIPSGGEEGKPAAPVRTVSLSPGELLKGRVVRVEENGRVLLAIDEELVAARTPLKLAEGSEYWLEVRRGGAEPWLALAGRKGAAGELLRLLAAGEAGRGKALALLLRGGAGRHQLPPIASILSEIAGMMKESAFDGEADPAKVIFNLLLLQDSAGKKKEGILRHRLADLLAVLPQEAAGRKEGESLARILAAMEEMNGHPSTAGERFFIFPCLLAGDAGWGEWLLTPDDSGEAAPGGAGYELSFFLRLSLLGELHLQLAVRGEAIRGIFGAASPEARQHLEANLPELIGLLEQLGFARVHLSCRLAERHLLQELQEILCRRAGLASLALIDLRA